MTDLKRDNVFYRAGVNRYQSSVLNVESQSCIYVAEQKIEMDAVALTVWSGSNSIAVSTPSRLQRPFILAARTRDRAFGAFIVSSHQRIGISMAFDGRIVKDGGSVEKAYLETGIVL
jgi:hypothetical protein